MYTFESLNLNLLKSNFLDTLNDDTLKVVYLLGADQIKIKPINKAAKKNIRRFGDTG